MQEWVKGCKSYLIWAWIKSYKIAGIDDNKRLLKISIKDLWWTFIYEIYINKPDRGWRIVWKMMKEQ